MVIKSMYYVIFHQEKSYPYWSYSNYVSPLKRWGHVGLLLYPQFVCSVCVCAFCPSVCPIHFRRSNTRRWPNAGLVLAHRLRCWPNISPVLGYRVVFSTTLNVGQRHRRWANFNQALVQSIVLVPQAWSTDFGWMNTAQHRPCLPNI